MYILRAHAARRARMCIIMQVTGEPYERMREPRRQTPPAESLLLIF